MLSLLLRSQGCGFPYHHFGHCSASRATLGYKHCFRVFRPFASYTLISSSVFPTSFVDRSRYHARPAEPSKTHTRLSSIREFSNMPPISPKGENGRSSRMHSKVVSRISDDCDQRDGSSKARYLGHYRLWTCWAYCCHLPCACKPRACLVRRLHG